MNTAQIYTGLKKNRNTRWKFNSVYAADDIYRRKPHLREQFIVVNLDPSWKEGSHWVAMKISRNKNGNEYFDSYGKPPPYSEFNIFLKNNFIYNKLQLQNELSTTCGQWTMLYIWARCRGITLKKFLTLFNPNDTLLNDHMVNQAVNNLFETNTKVINKNFLCAQICKSKRDEKCIVFSHQEKCKKR